MINATSLNLAIVVQAAQALVEEVSSDALCRTLMSAVLTAGEAETAYLILQEEGQLWLEAIASLQAGNVNVQQVLRSGNIPLTQTPALLPISIVQAAIAQKNSLLLPDATIALPYATDPYIQTHQPKSVLCLPLQGQGRLLGALYLEHRTTINAFQKQHLDLLKILAAQFAIALQNIQLHQLQQQQQEAPLTEISDRQHLESALRQSEATNQAIIKAIPDLLMRMDQDGNYCQLINASESTRQLHVLLPDKPIQETTIWDILPPELAMQRLHYTQQAIATGELQVYEQALEIDGGTYHEEIRISVINANEVLVIVRDITARKLAEEALSQSEANKRALLSALPDLIIRVDADGIYREFIATDLFKTIGKTGDFVGTHVSDSLPPDLAEKRLNAIQAALTTGHIQVYEQDIWVDGALQTEECRVVVSGDNEVLVIVRDISKRKRSEIKRQQAELSLRQSEAQNRAIIAAIPDLMLRVRPDGSCVEFIAPRIAREADKFVPISKHISEVIPAELIDPLLQAYQRAIATGDLQVLEHQFPKNGQLCYEEVRIVACNTDELLVIVRDITDRKQTEAALQQSEEQYRRIVETATEGIWIIDAQGNTSFVNPRMADILGYTVTEMVGQPLSAFMDETSQIIAPLNIDRQQQDIQEQHDCKFQRKDGSDLWVIISTNPIWDSTGQYAGALGMVTDISDRKQAELAIQGLNEELEKRVHQRTQELLRSQAALQEQEQFLRSIYDGFVYPIFVLDILDDGSSRLKGWNLATEQRVGVKSTAVAGKPIEAIFPPHEATEISKHYRQCWQTGAPVKVEEHLVLNGESRHMVTTYSPVKDNTGKVYRIVGTAIDITDRKQAEQRLAERNAILRSVIESTTDPIFVKDRQGRILIVNSAFANFFNQPPEQLLGKSDAELWAPDIVKHIQSIEHRIMTMGVSETLEELVTHPDGVRTYLTTKSPWRDEQGHIVGLVGMARDISDRIRAEETLRDREERLRLALTATNQGLYDLDLKTGNAIVSPEYATMLGYEPAEFQETNARWIERLHPDDRERVANVYLAYVRGDIADYVVEFRQRTKTGEWKWILSLGKIVARDEQGNPLRMLGTHTDISARKAAEEALRQSETRFRRIFESNVVGMVFSNLDGTIVDANDRFLDMVGYTQADLQAGRMRWDVMTPPEYRHTDQRAVEQLLHQGVITPWEKEYIRRDGSRIPVLIGAAVLEDETVQSIAVVVDISAQQAALREREQAEQALRQVNSELESRVEDRTAELRKAMEVAETANRAKSSFLANMSHELRTPLNAILGFAQLMSRDTTLDPDKRQQLGIINRSGEHLLNLINDILEMSKIEAGRTTFNPNCFDLYALLDTLEEMFQLRTTHKGLTLTFERTPDVPQYIRTDEHKLRQILINLLGNAVKFTPSGSVTLRVGWMPPGDQPQLTVVAACHLSFAVIDTGIGIDASELDSIFHPFMQSRHRQIAHEGTGLGLPISQQFVQLMGGHLNVTSQLGQGSTFTVHLPVEIVKAGALPMYQAPQRVLGLAPNQPTYRILAVEDNETNCQLLVQLLKTIGFDVQAASNGQAAIALWETWQPHLIWMDMRMPILDGYEATRQIRQREQAQRAHGSNQILRTKIIALTASAFEEERAKVLKVGCDDFVRKPFQENVLLEKMATQLNLQYIYAASPPNVAPPPTHHARPAIADIMAAMKSLPSPWLHQLHEAAMRLDSHTVSKLIDPIRSEQAALADLLSEKLDNFDFEEIMHLVQEVITN